MKITDGDRLPSMPADPNWFPHGDDAHRIRLICLTRLTRLTCPTSPTS